jgi:hypothetical protein
LAFSIDSSIPELAAENHPGRSGTTTPHDFFGPPISIAIGYFINANRFVLLLPVPG